MMLMICLLVYIAPKVPGDQEDEACHKYFSETQFMF